MYMTLVSGWFLGHPPGTEMLLPVLKGYSDRKNDFIFENGAIYSESGFTGGSNQERTHLQMQETQETQVPSLDQEDPLEEEMGTHSSILAWEIPWTEEPGMLQSRGLQRV